MCTVIACTNRKGGTGKSTTVVNLGASLAKQGKKVLVIDGDSQHSLTVSLGVKEPDKLKVTLATVMSRIITDEDFDPAAGIIYHEEGIDLMPSNNSLAGIEIVLAPLIGRETILRQYISKVKPLYQYILIDTAPTLDLLTVNALAAANSVIVPVAPKFLDAKGLELLLKSIAQVRRQINPDLSIKGILLTMVDKRARFTKDIIEMIEQAYGEQINIFKDAIPHSIRAVETSATGKSIFSHDPRGKVASAYTSFTQEFLANMEGSGHLPLTDCSAMRPEVHNIA
jgi:chromosome partitioning protein